MEGALRELRARDVYVTYEEFKGRKPIVRGSFTLAVEAADFDNPFARRDLTARTGGSTGLASPVPLGLDYFAARAPHQALFQQAYQLDDVPTAYWLSILPGSGLQFILQRTDLRDHCTAGSRWRAGATPISGSGTAPPRSGLLAWMRAFGGRVPLPEVLRLDDAMVADALDDRHREGRGRLPPAHQPEPRPARRGGGAGGRPRPDRSHRSHRRRADHAGQAGRDGARRPPRRSRLRDDRDQHQRARLPAAVAADDLHLLSDAFALITHPFAVGVLGTTVPAFNLTTLVDTTPKVMLNVQIDDYGTVEERRCGCPFESLGFTTHVHGIRSYSKLVGEGITLIGNDVQHILEHTLPARYGGSALDYQLLEEEDARGFTRAYL